MKIQHILAFLLPLFLFGCDLFEEDEEEIEDDCFDCQLQLEEAKANMDEEGCFIVYTETPDCSEFVRNQGLALMEESCREGKNETALCSYLGRHNVNFQFATFSAIPDTVTIIMESDGTSSSWDMWTGRTIVDEFPGFIYANTLVTVQLYNTNTNELILEATPKVTYVRSAANQYSSRRIEIDYVDDDYSLYFFGFE